MKVKIKKLHKDAVIPFYASIGDAGMDITAVSKEYNEELNYVEYGSGLAIELPENHVGLFYPRSSLTKTNLVLINSVGVLDSKFRGEFKLRFFRRDKNITDNEYAVGDRFAQLIIMPYPLIEFEESDELSDTERGEGGFGSTGK